MNRRRNSFCAINSLHVQPQSCISRRDLEASLRCSVEFLRSANKHKFAIHTPPFHAHDRHGFIFCRKKRKKKIAPRRRNQRP